MTKQMESEKETKLNSKFTKQIKKTQLETNLQMENKIEPEMETKFRMENKVEPGMEPVSKIRMENDMEKHGPRVETKNHHRLRSSCHNAIAQLRRCGGD